MLNYRLILTSELYLGYEIIYRLLTGVGVKHLIINSIIEKDSMNQVEEIKAMLKDGSYYKDALAWYSSKYIFAFTQRASMLVITAILSVGLVISIDAARTNFGSLQIPFPIYAKDEVNFFPIIKPLAYQNDSIEMSVARYFSKKYIELRESYNFTDFSDENSIIIFNKIKALSSHVAYRQYEEFIDPNYNTDSPIIKYKNQIQRIITINDVQINNFDELPESAVIKYTATQKNKDDLKNEDYVAEITFMMSDITKVFEKTEPLFFRVVSYKTYKLSK